MTRLLPILAIGLMGCATTRLETPLGTYVSNRDSTLDQLTIEIVEQPDGSKTTRIEMGGARGDASSVIQAQAEMIRVALETAFTLGRAARGAP